ncbi:MAG: glycosyl transferase [Microbacterium sp.]
MRFVWAVVAFFLAAVCIAGGIAQRTVLMGPKTETATIAVSEELAYTLIDGSVLSRMPGTQTLVVRGEGTVFAAYGRTSDMTAWLSDAEYNHVTVVGGRIATDQVAPTSEPDDDASASPEPSASPDAQDCTPCRDPAGSDLWLDEFQEDGALVAPLSLPEDMSVLVASDGTAAAPSDITVSWPIDNATPWAGPLIVLGGMFLALGVVLWLLGIRHVRRSRGPRRRGLPALPETPPADLADEESGKGVISAGTPQTVGAAPTRRSVGASRRGFVVLPAMAVSVLLFAGCSAEAWPQLGAGTSPTPTPSETVIVPEGQQEPAVTQAQAERILAEISQTVAEADEARDATVAGTRLTGATLAERKTNYTLTKKVEDQEALPAIPTKPLAVLLPQQYDGWPRTVMSIVYDKDDATVAPTITMMTQQDPWSAYKVSYLANLEASAELPDLAPAWVGAIAVQPDSPFLVLEPGKLAKAYANVLNKGDESQYAGLFDLTNDSFQSGVAADRQKRLDAFNKTGKKTASLTFASTAGPEEPLALATLESGAIVAVNLYETDTVKPTNADAVIKLTDNPTVKALTGVTQSATGFTTTFSDQLFFYVPGQGSTEKIRLLGYGSNLLSASVIKKSES